MLFQRGAEAVAVEAGDHLPARYDDRPLDKIRLLGHQRDRIVGAQSFPRQAHRLEGGAARIQKIPRVAAREQILELSRAQRGLCVVALVELRAKFFPQETSCVAAGRSSRFPDETDFPHARFSCWRAAPIWFCAYSM